MEFDNIIKTRHSGRDFDENKFISKDQISELIYASGRSPSCYGEEPWRMLFCSKNHNPQGWQNIFDSLVPKNQEWNRNVPLLIAVSYLSTFSLNGNINNWAEYDTGAAALALAFKASDLGLVAHQMAGFDKEILSKSINLPDDQKLQTVIAIGYSKELNDPKELSKRKNPNDLFKIADSW